MQLTASNPTQQTRQTRLTRRLIQHHLPLAIGTIAAIVVLYATRPYRDWIARASFATAYPALLLVAVTLWIGPWNLLRRRRTPVSTDLRRDIGIWAGITGIAHAVIGQCVHLRGRPWLYYVYGKSGHLLPFRHDSFGWANHTGLLSALVLLALLATSNDFSLKALGTPQWKKLQRCNYVCFGLAVIHTLLYQSSEKLHGPFGFAVVLGTTLTVLIQLAGVYRRRQQNNKALA
jgi:methionine sulfoxide reductase heme-binding subunit